MLGPRTYGVGMKDLILAASMGVVLIGGVGWSVESTPIVQKSNKTQEVVSCASHDTKWEVRDAEDPICIEVAAGTAEVEWVP